MPAYLLRSGFISIRNETESTEYSRFISTIKMTCPLASTTQGITILPPKITHSIAYCLSFALRSEWVCFINLNRLTWAHKKDLEKHTCRRVEKRKKNTHLKYRLFIHNYKKGPPL